MERFYCINEVEMELLWRQHRGGRDEDVIELNREAYARLPCAKELSIVPGATHLFEEAGTLEEVARQAATWFSQYLKT